MQEYLVIIICMAILLLCGVLKAPCKAVGYTSFRVLFILFCAAALSQFNWRASVEVCINAGAGAMVFVPVLLAKGNDNGNGVLSVMVLFAAISAFLGNTGYFYGSSNGLMCGILGGLSAVMLAGTPSNAVFSACAVPVFGDIIEAFLEMAETGYASLEIDTITLTAQLIGISIAVAVVWISELSAAVIKTE